MWHLLNTSFVKRYDSTNRYRHFQQLVRPLSHRGSDCEAHLKKEEYKQAVKRGLDSLRDLMVRGRGAICPGTKSMLRLCVGAASHSSMRAIRLSIVLASP